MLCLESVSSLVSESPPHWAKVPCDNQQVEVLATIYGSGLLTWSTVRFLPPHTHTIPEMFEMVLYGLWISTLHILVVIVIFVLLRSIRRNMLYEQNKMEIAIKRMILGLICNRDGSGRWQVPVIPEYPWFGAGEGVTSCYWSPLTVAATIGRWYRF